MSTTYDVGDRRKLSVIIRDEEGLPADPGFLEFSIREPDGDITSYQYGINSELIRTGVGIYFVYWDCAKNGLHRWRFEAGGNVVVAEQTTFAVRPPSV